MTWAHKLLYVHVGQVQSYVLDYAMKNWFSSYRFLTSWKSGIWRGQEMREFRKARGCQHITAKIIVLFKLMFFRHKLQWNWDSIPGYHYHNWLATDRFPDLSDTHSHRTHCYAYDPYFHMVSNILRVLYVPAFLQDSFSLRSFACSIWYGWN